MDPPLPRSSILNRLPDLDSSVRLKFSSGMNRPVVERQPVMFSLLRAAHVLEHRLETALAGAGLSMAKFKVVSQLADAGESLPLSELASRQSCVRSNMTQ